MLERVSATSHVRVGGPAGFSAATKLKHDACQSRRRLGWAVGDGLRLTKQEGAGRRFEGTGVASCSYFSFSFDSTSHRSFLCSLVRFILWCGGHYCGTLPLGAEGGVCAHFKDVFLSPSCTIRSSSSRERGSTCTSSSSVAGAISGGLHSPATTELGMRGNRRARSARGRGG